MSNITVFWIVSEVVHAFLIQKCSSPEICQPFHKYNDAVIIIS